MISWICLITCVIFVIAIGALLFFYSIAEESWKITCLGVIVFLIGIVGMLGVPEDTSQYISAMPIAYNSTQTVFATNKDNIIVDGIYPDGKYMLILDGKDVLVVWQAVNGGVE